jgi:MFS family permease
VGLSLGVVVYWQSATSFHILRFLLGIAECGTFPGMWYHLSLFYTAADLGPAYAVVTSATALASVLGGFLAAGLLCMDGVGGEEGVRYEFPSLHWRTRLAAALA